MPPNIPFCSVLTLSKTEQTCLQDTGNPSAMETQTFMAGSRRAVAAQVKHWRAAHPGIVEASCVFAKTSLRAGRIAPSKKLEKTFVTACIEYEGATAKS